MLFSGFLQQGCSEALGASNVLLADRRKAALGRDAVSRKRYHEESGKCIPDIRTDVQGCPCPYTKGVPFVHEGCYSIDGQDALRFCLAMPIDRRTRWALRGISLLRQSTDSSDLRRCTLSCAHSALPHNPLRRTAVDLPKGNFRLSLSTAVARSLACPNRPNDWSTVSRDFDLRHDDLSFRL